MPVILLSITGGKERARVFPLLCDLSGGSQGMNPIVRSQCDSTSVLSPHFWGGL